MDISWPLDVGNMAEVAFKNNCLSSIARDATCAICTEVIDLYLVIFYQGKVPAEVGFKNNTGSAQ